MIDLDALDRPPAGFGACVECAYRDTGSAPICFACASEYTEPIPEDACDVCDQQLREDGSCPNFVCNWDDRYFRFVWAISMRTGEMRRAISRYKYDGRVGWAPIFGRILVGFLNEYAPTFRDYDLITPSPTFTGEGGRPFDHVGEIVRAAEVVEPIRWPFEFDLIIKEFATRSFVDLNWRERKAESEGPLRGALQVPHPSQVTDKRILVFDDVFTEGFTIREVARALIHAGATEVSEVVLAREPWKGG